MAAAELLSGRPRRPARRTPPRGVPAEHLLLACEVVVSSLGYDRTQKAAAYARAGIRECWIVDVERGVLHVLTDPDPATATYRDERTLEASDEVLLPNGIRLSAADLLPP
ncbi:MAG: Uma2 family endonuclease [Deltaproteobacteria bacterium]|nr:Uma2 family endonuclease [Deltaproteobacteria bacterium]